MKGYELKMKSKYKSVNAAIEILIERREDLRTEKQVIRDRIDEKYPLDKCGEKGDMLFAELTKKQDDEIKVLSRYISGMYDLMEMIEQPNEG